MGLRASRTMQVWLHRVHGRMRSGCPARSLATRSGSANWARVISTRSALAGSSYPPRAHSGLADVGHRPLQHHGHRDAGADLIGQADVDAGRLVVIGSGLFDREDRAPHDDEVVDVVSGQRGRQLDRGLGGDARPGRELVARQSQPDDRISAGGAPHGRDDIGGETQTISAPLVAALVGQPGEELAHEAVLPGVDLDAVAAGGHGGGGGRGEPVHDGGDVGRLHPLRHLAGRHLGDTRRRPQRTLAVRRRALAAGVVERRQHQAAVRVTGLADGVPSVRGLLGERRSLVRPVGFVDAGTLDDDRAAPAAGSPLVVGDVAIGEVALVVAQIGDVRSEHHAVRGRPRAQVDGVEKPHGGGHSGRRPTHRPPGADRAPPSPEFVATSRPV